MGKTGIGKSTIFNILSGKKCIADSINCIKVLDSDYHSLISSKGSETKVPIIGVTINN